MRTYLLLFLFAFGPVNAAAQDKISYTYTITQDATNSSLYVVQSTLVNLSNQDVYFLTQSCNGLDYALKTESNSLKPYPLIHCNASYPLKQGLKAHCEYAFTTIFKAFEPLNESVQIQLEFTTIDQNITPSELKLAYTTSTLSKSTKIIRGPVINF